MIRETSPHNPRIPFSFMKTSLFLLIFIVFLIFLIGIPLLCIFLILKPQMPVFSVQTVHVESYKLNVTSQNLLVSSVFFLNVTAENPNKVALSYEPSRFHVLSQGLVVGLIRIPQFHQPPLSKNVSVQTRVLFERVNVREIMSGSSRKEEDGSSSKGAFDIRILGDVRAQVRVFHMTLPMIKVALDCDLSVNESKFSVSNELHSIRWSHNQMISVPLNSKTVSKKCSLAILM